MRRVSRGAFPLAAGFAAGLALLLGPPPARGQNPPERPESAIRYARNAFEYRDFDRVVEVLWPWLHPPRIVDTDLAVRARELLGISLFLVGRRAEAEEEFSALLLLDPDHALDPFLVPPDVIQSFEKVKKAMGPTLRALREKRPVAPEEPDPAPVIQRELVEVPHPAVAFVPFGVPQFVLDRPGWGGFFLGSQVAGLALNGASFWQARSVAANSSEYDVWVALQYVGLGIAVVSYVGSVLQGSEGLRERRQSARADALAAPVARTPPP